MCYLNEENKKVVGTTYRELRHLVKSIEQWGFFGSISEAARDDDVPNDIQSIASNPANANVVAIDDAVNSAIVIASNSDIALTKDAMKDEEATILENDNTLMDSNVASIKKNKDSIIAKNDWDGKILLILLIIDAKNDWNGDLIDIIVNHCCNSDGDSKI